MSKAIQVHTPGGPEAMVYEDVNLGPPGKGEVRIRHHAIGLNYIDVYFRSGAYPAATSPFTPGSEAAGEIVALGEGVTGFSVGDRVAYVAPPGAYCEERNLATHWLVKLPDGISYETAAGMMLKGMTAEYLLFRTYKVQAGDTILVQAAAGGVGLLLCQWSKKLGATVIGTVGDEEKAKLARQHGADHTILYRSENFADKVKEMTGGKLCNVVYDGVGQSTFPASLDCLRPFGTFVSFGAASGTIAAFDIGILGKKGSLYATRPTLFSFLADRAILESMSARLFKAVEAGDVTIPVTQRFKLQDAGDSHRALEGRKTTGSVILLP